MNSNEATATQNKFINKKQQKMIDRQDKALDTYVGKKQAESERKAKDLEAAKKQISDLEAEMKKCKCPAW